MFEADEDLKLASGGAEFENCRALPLPKAPMPAHEKDALSVRMWRIEHNLYTTNENLVQRVNTFEDNITVQIHGIKELIGKINATAHFAAVPPSSPAPSQDLLNAPTISHYGMRPTFRRCHSTKLPDPPTVHLSKDIDRLCREWEQSTLLVVNRRGIPVQYWPEFYKKVKGASGGLGSNSKDEWFSYKHVLDALAKEHSANASQDAADAHFFFGNDLGHPDAKGAFSYVKSGKTFLASKDDAIARKWIKLLDDDPEISSRVRNQPAAVTLVATACLHPRATDDGSGGKDTYHRTAMMLRLSTGARGAGLRRRPVKSRDFRMGKGGCAGRLQMAL
ncbi:hypothetical protein F5I97DRAFT_1827022 [Phlebopus sp. FC_14]|nr:hypothetical protein F5I97DRAFT_1827022 [Phlebopus sp. FC_14]